MITVSSTHAPHHSYSPTSEVWASMFVTADIENRALLADALDRGVILESVLVHMKNMTWIVTNVMVEQADREQLESPIKIKFNGAMRYT